MAWTLLEKDIARERIQGVAQSCWLGACLKLPSGCFKPHKIRQIYLLFIILFVAGVAGGVNCFLTRYWPYRRIFRFIDVTCATFKTEMTSRNLTCSCGESCWGTYGCLVVWTRYKTLEGKNVTTVLSATNTDLSISREFQIPRCTYHPPCGSHKYDAARYLEEFRRIISKPGTRYTCLYDTERPNDVIQYRDVDPEQTASLLIGAGVVAAIGLLGCIIVAAVCGCSYVFSCSPPHDIRREAEVRVVELEAMKKIRRTRLVELEKDET